MFSSISLFGGKLLPNPLYTPDPTGVLSTYSTAGGIDIDNPFFQSLGDERSHLQHVPHIKFSLDDYAR